tara:strand:- start:192 stop:356 length:165 start_codon:yes stop_codon:yes gene_type:complete
LEVDKLFSLYRMKRKKIVSRPLNEKEKYRINLFKNYKQSLTEILKKLIKKKEKI